MATKGIVKGIVSNLVTVEVDGPVSQNEICYISAAELQPREYICCHAAHKDRQRRHGYGYDKGIEKAAREIQQLPRLSKVFDCRGLRQQPADTGRKIGICFQCGRQNIQKRKNDHHDQNRKDEPAGRVRKAATCAADIGCSMHEGHLRFSPSPVSDASAGRK